MGFFGEIIDGENAFETEIPDGYSLTITQACLDPLETVAKGKLSILRVQTINEENSFIVSVLNTHSSSYQTPLNHQFRSEDSPITFTVVGGGGAVHLTGIWAWDEKAGEEEHCHADTDSENECGEHGHESDSEDEEEEEVEEEEEEVVVVPVKETKGDKKRPRSSSSDSTAPVAVVTTSKQVAVTKQPVVAPVVVEKVEKVVQPKEKKAKVEKKVEEKVVDEDEEVSTEKKKSGNQRKKWRVKPQNDEGILVLEPKQLKQTSGVTITDYVIGKGVVPKPGAKLKIVYEGSYPDGTVFDSSLKRTKPFTFRKGTGQVIKGLDRGLEGVKIGGSREIIIPSELGYGSEGIGEIPGNQTLVFRVTLIGQNK